MRRRALVVPLVGVVLAALFGTVATLLAGWRPGLALDLQGGASVVLKPTQAKVDSGSLDQAKRIIANRVNALGVAEAEVVRQGDAIIVSLPGVKDQKRALSLVGATAELTFRPVLSDLPANENTPIAPAAPAVSTSIVTVGGSSTTVSGSTAPSSSVAPSRGPTKVGAQAATTAPPGAAPATTAAPAVADPSNEVVIDGGAGFGRSGIKLAALTAGSTTPSAPSTPRRASSTTPSAPSTTPSAPSTTSKAGGATPTSISAVAAPTTTVKLLPIKNTPLEEIKANNTIVAAEKSKGKTVRRYLLGPSEVSGRAVKSAQAVINQQGQWEVDLSFNSEGSKAWDAMAAKYVGRRIAVTLDDSVKSAPVIQVAQFNGRAVISGNYSGGEAKDLALVLRYGSLPVQLAPQTVQTISPSLGKDSLRAGVITGLIGLTLVALYMVFYYRALGLIVLAGLSVSSGLMWTILAFLSHSRGLALSLSGAVGIIVSVGITVDSYVVYFERLRDEIRAGKTIRSSVDRGFKRAFRTIIAADSASFIGAAVLYYLTVGSVRGFAFFLGLSTLLDVAVAWLFTRPVVSLLGSGRFFTSGPLGITRGLAPATESAPSRLVPGGAR